jgi:hypothetical protein
MELAGLTLLFVAAAQTSTCDPLDPRNRMNETAPWSRTGRERPRDGTDIADRSSGYEILDRLDVRIIDIIDTGVTVIGAKDSCGCGGLGCRGKGCGCAGATHTACSCRGESCTCQGQIRKVCPQGGATLAACCGGDLEIERACGCSKTCRCGPITKGTFCRNNLPKSDAACGSCGGVTRDPVSCNCTGTHATGKCGCKNESGKICVQVLRPAYACVDLVCRCSIDCSCPPLCTQLPVGAPASYQPCGGAEATKPCACRKYDAKCQCPNDPVCRLSTKRFEKTCPHGGAAKTPCGCGDKCTKQGCCAQNEVCKGRTTAECPRADAKDCPVQHACKVDVVLDTGTKVIWQVFDKFGALNPWVPAGSFIPESLKPLTRSGWGAWDWFVVTTKTGDAGNRGFSDDPLKDSLVEELLKKGIGTLSCGGGTASCNARKDACCGGACACPRQVEGGVACNCAVAQKVGKCACTLARRTRIDCQCDK